MSSRAHIIPGILSGTYKDDKAKDIVLIKLLLLERNRNPTQNSSRKRRNVLVCISDIPGFRHAGLRDSNEVIWSPFLCLFENICPHEHIMTTSTSLVI